MIDAAAVFKKAAEDYKEDALGYAKKMIDELWDNVASGKSGYEDVQKAFDGIPSARMVLDNIVTDIVTDAIKQIDPTDEHKCAEVDRELRLAINPAYDGALVRMDAIQVDAKMKIESAAMKIATSRHGFSKLFRSLPEDTAKLIIVKAWVDAVYTNECGMTEKIERFDKLLEFADIIAQSVQQKPDDSIEIPSEAG